MNMKGHILTALKEQLNHWDELLGGLSEAQIIQPRFAGGWSIQDVVAHLWGWQQISTARLEAAAAGREPHFPEWTLALTGDWESDADRANARIYETQHEKSWPEVYQNWKAGYSRLLESAKPIPEPDLLDLGRYAWLEDYSLALILIASYDHHQEHLDILARALEAKEQR